MYLDVIFNHFQIASKFQSTMCFDWRCSEHNHTIHHFNTAAAFKHPLIFNLSFVQKMSQSNSTNSHECFKQLDEQKFMAEVAKLNALFEHSDAHNESNDTVKELADSKCATSKCSISQTPVVPKPSNSWSTSFKNAWNSLTSTCYVYVSKIKDNKVTIAHSLSAVAVISVGAILVHKRVEFVKFIKA